MKSFLTILCAVTLAGASFAAQSAPVSDSQRVVAELLGMAQERNAAGDVEMARALTEQASRMMGGQHEAGLAAPRVLRMAEGVPLTLGPQSDSRRVQLRFQGEPEATALIELAEAAEPAEWAELAELAELGYATDQVVDVAGQPLDAFVMRGEPLQDDLHATLMSIREELHALRAEVGALRAEIAGRNGNRQFRGGMMAPGPNGEMPQGGFMFHAPAQPAQGFYFQQGAPSAPGVAPSGNWNWQGGPQDAPSAPRSGPAGQAGEWQRLHEQASTEAAAARHDHAALQEAHRAALAALRDAFAGQQPPPPPPAAPRSGDENANPRNLH